MRALLPAVLCAAALAAVEPAGLIRVQDIRAQLKFLSTDNMAGRDTASPGGRIAADYIASEFERMGLRGAGDGGGYFQDFDLVEYQVDEPRLALKVRRGGVEKSYALKHDFQWSRQSANPATASGPLVFAGYGVDAPEYGYNDFAGADLHGKIAMVLSWEPQQFDPHSKFKGAWNTMHAHVRYKIEQVRKAGAAGLLIVRDRTPVRRPRKSSAPPNSEAGASANFALAGSFWDLPVFLISPETADDLLSSGGQDVARLQQAIDSTGRPHTVAIPGVTVTMEKALASRRVVTTHNVIGMLEGSDPVLKSEYVIVTAHYDHVGVVGGRIYRGADDNASGTVGVLQIAKAFTEGGVRPRRSIVFAVFEAEERGLLGAQYYVDHPTVPLDKTVANLNMDMIGRDEESTNWDTKPEQQRNSVNVVGTLYNPGLRQMIEDSNRGIGLTLDFKTDTKDPEAWFARSDHFPFATRSVPMVLFNTGEHADYHTENDTWDRINYPKMEKIVRLVFLSAERAANGARVAFVR